MPRGKLQALFDSILVSPVLTAHPTEVRRKSVLDRENEVAQLLAERDRMFFTPAEAGAADTAMSRAVLTLWQTSLLRRGRPTVIDEVAMDSTGMEPSNASVYYTARRGTRHRGDVTLSLVVVCRCLLPLSPRRSAAAPGTTRARPRR